MRYAVSNPTKENFGVLWAVIKGRVHIGPRLTEDDLEQWGGNLKYGHMQWFERMGWPTSGREFDEITRGMIEVVPLRKELVPQAYYGVTERIRPIPNEVFNAFFRKYPSYRKYSIRELKHLNLGDKFSFMRKDPMAHPKANPIASAEQYGLMAAIASGATLRQDVGISQELAREMIRKTPRRLRSKFASELAKKRANPKRRTKKDLVDMGYAAAIRGESIDSFDTRNELERAAWEIGWRAGKKDRDKLFKHNNPSAEELTETWHGRPPEEVIDYEEVETHESDAAVLAELEELAIILDNHEDTISIEFGEDPPMLVANVATDTLEVLGGDQHLEFGEGWDISKSEISIGHVYLIAYCTDKHHLEGSTGKPESYEHFFGEEYYKSRGYKVSDYKDTAKGTASEQFFDDILEDGIVEDAIQAGYLPVMTYDTVNEKVKLVGGKYTIEDVGLRD